VLLNPLPVKDVSRLVSVVVTEMRNGQMTPLGGMSRLNAEDIRDHNTVFSGVAIAGFAPLALFPLNSAATFARACSTRTPSFIRAVIPRWVRGSRTSAPWSCGRA
jgi:hypothetical protein